MSAVNAAAARPARRQRWLRVMVLLVFIGFTVRLFDLQVVKAEELAAEGLEGRMVHTTTPAQRGDILSADGTTLATDVLRYSVEANQTEIALFVGRDADGAIIRDAEGRARYQGAEGAAELLAPELDLTQSEAFELLDGTAIWVELLKSASVKQWERIEALRVRGIFGVPFYRRAYPAGAVAGNLIGYPFEVDDDAANPVHYTGIEATQNHLLAGSEGEADVESAPDGQPIPGGQTSQTPAKAGCSVTLTIDSDLQYRAAQEIDQRVEELGAASGMVVAIDTETGEILALVDSGARNPLKIRGDADAIQGSRAVEQVFEPGSTGKVVTMAMVVETGEATPESRFSVPWKATFSGQEFKDHDEHGTANWTLNGILAKSSNIGTIMAAQNIPSQTRYDYLSKFGFGVRTGVELPAESPGILHVPNTPEWDGRTKNAVLFGQGVAVNGLQATGVYATLGNGGVAMPLHIVKGWQCPDGTSGATPITEGKRVVSAETARTVMDMLESVVDQGTGKTARIPGYRIAGKTGTSEEMMTDGTARLYVSSFIGLAPADHPKIAVGVIITDAKGSSWGSTVAAPVFKSVTEFALQRFAVPPSKSKAPKLDIEW